MGLFIKIALVVLLFVSIVSVIVRSQDVVKPYPNERYANFNEKQINYIRFMIQRAYIEYSHYYDPFGTIKEEISYNLFNAYPGFWNVVVYHKDDWKDKFYLTGMYDEFNRNKRFYQVLDTGSAKFRFSVIILETNNTVGSDISIFEGRSEKVEIKDNKFSVQKFYCHQMAWSYLVSNEFGYEIQAQISRTYSLNDNLVDLAVTVQEYLKREYNQKWELFVRLRDVEDLGFVYRSVDNHWAEYYYKQDFSKDITVMIFKNYIDG